jgi:hypothetical protein
VCGPPAPDAAPIERVVVCRRYRCCSCGAVVLVVPKGVVSRRRFTATAIAFALALYGSSLPVEIVRRLVNPLRIVGEAAQGDWIQLRRWARAARCGELFANARPCLPSDTLRQAAQRLSSMFVGLSGLPSTEPFEVRAFVGGLHGM